MNILGLLGSSRAWGNTELLVTEVAKAAVGGDSQITVRLLRLTDLRLAYCNGCMSCAMQEGGPCSLDDDMEFLLSEYRAADALILGAPAYTLLPPGPLKLIADRLIMYLARSEWLAPKPAVTVGVAGLPRWSELLVPLLNCTVLSQGFHLVDSFLAYGAGPGAVLLDPTNVERAQLAGQRLHRALSGQEVRMRSRPGCCPICGADFFRVTPTGIECPLCLAAGKLEHGVAVFDPSPANRWQPDALRRHFTGWIQGTGATYLEQRPAIRQLLRPYRQRPFPLIRPETAVAMGPK
jgi:multimeric flavodoxin WrbA